MAKKSTTSTTTTETTTTENTLPQETTKITETATTEIVPAPKEPMSQIIDWKSLLPDNYKKVFATNAPCEEGELEAALSLLSPKQQENFHNLLDRMNPEKEGIIEDRHDFRLPTARIFQGVGDDKSRPPTAPAGSVYTTDGRILCCFNETIAKTNKLKTRFIALPILMTNTSTFWRPKNEAGFVMPEGVPNDTVMICQSHDRKRGSRFGNCNACSYAPFKTTPARCKMDVGLYLVLKDFDGLYFMSLSGLSASDKGAHGSLKRITATQSSGWFKWCEFSLEQESNDKGTWYYLDASPAIDDNGDMFTSESERKFIRCLYRQIVNEDLMPKFKNIYSPKLTDQKLLEAASKPKLKQDYSDDM